MIDYKFTIVAVDTAARVMEILYTADGKQEHRVGARLPYEGESVESVAEQYAPVWHWVEQERQVIAPSVGLSGSLQYSVPVAAPDLSPEEIANRQMTEEFDFDRRVSKSLVRLGVIESDSTAIPQASL